MSKFFTVTRGLAIAASLSLLPATKLPITASYGQTVACLESIVYCLWSQIRWRYFVAWCSPNYDGNMDQKNGITGTSKESGLKKMFLVSRYLLWKQFSISVRYFAIISCSHLSSNQASKIRLIGRPVIRIVELWINCKQFERWPKIVVSRRSVRYKRISTIPLHKRTLKILDILEYSIPYLSKSWSSCHLMMMSTISPTEWWESPGY